MKRFYTSADVDVSEGGYSIVLDGKTIKTPSKADLFIPTEAAATLIAAEWNAQGDTIKPNEMVCARLANTAIDRVAPDRESVIDEIAGYGGSDLVCYRADHPERLTARQSEVWDPYMGFAAGVLRAPLMVTTGVMQIAQPEDSLSALRAAIAALSDHQLSAFFSLVTGFGSLILGFAAVRHYRDFRDVFLASQLDALYQEEEWGEDQEATAVRAALEADLMSTLAYYQAVTRHVEKEN